MFYYLYEIRNNLNGKIYVGVHKTRDMEDGYMGSGKVLRHAIAKHGIENFTKVVLETFENAETMYAREKEVVTDEFLMREDTYNLRRGGQGGFDFVNKHMSFEERKKRQSNGANSLNNKVKYDSELRQKMSKSSSDALKELHKKGLIRYDTFTGKTHSEETKEKMRKPKNQGEKNISYGTCWIYHELIGSRKCRKELLPEYLEQGWIKGRRMSK